MKEDVTELKRLADVLRDFNESHADQELKRINKKYSKYVIPPLEYNTMTIGLGLYQLINNV